MTSVQKYINSLQNIDFSEVTELSLRFELKSLLEAVSDRNVDILHEGKREGKFGAPDFKISDKNGIIGYVETKKIDENLDSVIKSDQIKKYIELSDNLLVTNYLEFIWIRKGIIELREKICTSENLAVFKNLSGLEATENLINQFLKETPTGINNSKALAHALATRTKILKDFLRVTIQTQIDNNAQSPLTGLLSTFQTSISSELTVSEFSDAFAQMLSYGIFLAKLNADNGVATEHALSLRNAKYYIPKSFELIHELVGFIDKLENDEYADTRWIVEEIIALLNNLDVKAIQLSLSFNKNKNPDSTVVADPYLYFYEEFLSVYDAKLRKSKGVYYTPPEIVSFIVSSAGQLLENEFGIKQQFADGKNVTVLDFATGTGTFILEILKQILNSVPPNSTKRQILIQEHILKNIYGFEYLIAPYTIAHLKLSQFLKENNYEMQSKERLQVYLTNTIEPLNTQYNVFVQALSKEGETAQKIKEKPILVITGNPPYSNSSTNKNPFILNLLNDYKIGLNEQKINLDDDYIKFIRFAHNKIEKTGKGIVAIITNNSYLDGVTHRRMRQKLHEDFDKIYIVNLHGNAIKKEGDENVFDIRVGVSILFLIKNFTKNSKIGKVENEVYYFSVKEHNLISRKHKFEYLKNTEFENVAFEKLNLTEPYYWFTDKVIDENSDYHKFWSVTDIFKTYSVGIGTKVDKISIDFIKEKLEKRIQRIIKDKPKISELIQEYDLNENTTWEYERALKANFDKNNIVEYDYRPFDTRYIFYDIQFLSRNRKEVMDNFFGYQNMGIIVPRQSKLPDYNHAFITNKISDESFLAGGRDLGAGVVFPLYLYSDQTGNGNGLLFEKVEGRKLNYSDNFKHFIKDTFKDKFTAEEVFYYIYAVLHSPTYREKYVEFLKIDFPKIPFTDNFKTFETLSKLGEQLVNAHIFKEIPSQDVGIPMGLGTTEVTKIQFKENRLYYNETNYFDTVSDEIYNFKIGSYQVIDKYLKERKNRKLENNEILRMEEIINVIDFTIKQMGIIDNITKEWI